jgi:hypothetical protein
MDEDLGLAAKFDVDFPLSDISYQTNSKVWMCNLITNVKTDGRRVVFRRSIGNNRSGRLASRLGGRSSSGSFGWIAVVMFATAGSASDTSNLTLFSNSNDDMISDVLTFPTTGVDIIPRIQVADYSNIIRHKVFQRNT